ncbi:hypothetical protein EGW08_003852 [Elysia chlorotica]|uniref:Transmembrane protein 45B n=1 Tax=Elysia chlorotica TaxID=188477 RepID=A0A433U3L0_ELYCH|nr:hypothetical protein EGW08_003852 [Elysia chlorotica]
MNDEEIVQLYTMEPASNRDIANLSNSTVHKEHIPGTLSGHLTPLIGWFIVGLSYVISTFKHFYDRKLQRSKFKSSVELPYRFNCERRCICSKTVLTVPFTAWAKFIFGNMYLIPDILFAGLEHMKTKTILPHFQHDTIAATFILSGAVDLLCVWPCTSRLLPAGVDYVFFSITFLTEVLQFMVHLHGRTPVDVRLHQLQAAVAAMSVVALAGEACFRNRPEFPVIRGLLIALQGTWMFHLVLILYHPLGLKPWDLHSDENVALVSLFFSCHIILLVYLGLGINLLFAWLYSAPVKRKERSKDIKPLITWSS